MTLHGSVCRQAAKITRPMKFFLLLFFDLPTSRMWHVAIERWFMSVTDMVVLQQCSNKYYVAPFSYMQLCSYAHMYILMNASLDLPLNATTSGLNWYPVLHHWITAGILMPVCWCVYICVNMLLLSCCQHYCLGSWPSDRLVTLHAQCSLALVAHMYICTLYVACLILRA